MPIKPAASTTSITVALKNATTMHEKTARNHCQGFPACCGPRATPSRLSGRLQLRSGRERDDRCRAGNAGADRELPSTIIINIEGKMNSCDRYGGSAPAANSESNIRSHIACGRAGQSLCERKAGRKLLLRKPAALLHCEGSDLCNDSQSAAGIRPCRFLKGKKESTECWRLGDAFNFAASFAHARTHLACAVAYSASPLVDLSHHWATRLTDIQPRIYADTRESEEFIRPVCVMLDLIRVYLRKSAADSFLTIGTSAPCRFAKLD